MANKVRRPGERSQRLGRVPCGGDRLVLLAQGGRRCDEHEPQDHRGEDGSDDRTDFRPANPGPKVAASGGSNRDGDGRARRRTRLVLLKFGTKWLLSDRSGRQDRADLKRQ